MIDISVIPAFATWATIKKRLKFSFGGRGGGKSEQIGRLLLDIGRKRKLRILCAREIQKSIKDSVHSLLKDLIEKYGTNIENDITTTIEIALEFIYFNHDYYKNVKNEKEIKIDPDDYQIFLKLFKKYNWRTAIESIYSYRIVNNVIDKNGIITVKTEKVYKVPKNIELILEDNNNVTKNNTK